MSYNINYILILLFILLCLGYSQNVDNSAIVSADEGFNNLTNSNAGILSDHDDYWHEVSCSTDSDCNKNAKCNKRSRKYICECNKPYVGDGKYCFEKRIFYYFFSCMCKKR